MYYDLSSESHLTHQNKEKMQRVDAELEERIAVILADAKAGKLAEIGVLEEE